MRRFQIARAIAYGKLRYCDYSQHGELTYCSKQNIDIPGLTECYKATSLENASSSTGATSAGTVEDTSKKTERERSQQGDRDYFELMGM